MSDFPWIRFFPSDWLAGTRGMSAAETGVYITLIATMYERREPLAEDHKRLARLCGASLPTFKSVLEILIDEGKVQRTDDGIWNERVQVECSFSDEKSQAARKNANARWSKKHNKNNGAGIANALPTDSGRNANQKPEPEPEPEPEKKIENDTVNSIPKKPAPEPKPVSDFDLEFDQKFWPQYPLKKSKGGALKAFRTARKKTDLSQIMHGVHRYAAQRDGQDQRFTKHAATWLNDQCWLDEPDPPPNPSNQTKEDNFGNAVSELNRRLNGHEPSDFDRCETQASQGVADELHPPTIEGASNRIFG